MPGVEGALPKGALIGFWLQCQALILDSERKNDGQKVTSDRYLGAKLGGWGARLEVRNLKSTFTMAHNSPPLSGRKALRKGFGDNENTRVATGQCSWLVFTALGHLMQNSSAELSSALWGRQAILSLPERQCWPSQAEGLE